MALGVRYLEDRRNAKSGYRGFYFNIPKAVKESGVLDGRPLTLGDDPVEASRLGKAYNDLIDSWKSGGVERMLEEREAKRQGYTVQELVNEYHSSRYYLRLARSTRQSYDSALKAALGTKLDGIKFGLMKARMVRRRDADALYDALYSNSGPAMAKLCVAVLTRVFSLAALTWEWVDKNPFHRMETDILPSREAEWTTDQIKAFFDAATAHRCRSVGLLAVLAFDLMQRPVDIRLLKWDEGLRQTADGYEAFIQQTKTSAKVWVPLSDFSIPMVKETFRYSPYVCGNERTRDPWTGPRLTAVARQIMRVAGIPDDLQIRDLRRTAATEGVDAEATEDELRSAGGWKTRRNLNVYAKRTKVAAGNLQRKRMALRARRENAESA